MTAEDPLWGTFATFSILNIISPATKTKETRRHLRCSHSQPFEAPFRGQYALAAGVLFCCVMIGKFVITNTEHYARKLTALTNESKQTSKHQHPDFAYIQVVSSTLVIQNQKTKKKLLKKMRRGEKKAEKLQSSIGKMNKEHMKLIRQSGRQWQEESMHLSHKIAPWISYTKSQNGTRDFVDSQFGSDVIVNFLPSMLPKYVR